MNRKSLPIIIAVAVAVAVAVALAIFVLVQNLILAIVIGVCVIFVIYFVNRLAQMAKQWETFAEHHHLKYERAIHPYPAISGIYRGHTIKAQIYPVGDDEDAHLGTSVVADLENPKELSLEILPATFLGRMIGNDVTTGDARFDQRFKIKGNNRDMIKRIVDALMREKILEVKDFNLRVEHTKASFEVNQGLYDTGKLQIVLDLMIDIIERIETVR